MKTTCIVFHMHILLSLICLLSMVCIPTSARHHKRDVDAYTTIRSSKQYVYSGNGHDNEPHSTFERYICEVSQGSPLADDVQTAAFDLLGRKGWRWCQQQNRFGSRCTRVTNHGTASISICGKFLSRMKCKDLAYEVMHMALACRRNIGAKLLQGGKVVFEGGYIGVYHS